MTHLLLRMPYFVYLAVGITACSGSPGQEAIAESRIPEPLQPARSCLGGILVRWTLRADTSSLRMVRSGDDLRIFPDERIRDRILKKKGRRADDPLVYDGVRGWLVKRCKRLSRGSSAECARFFEKPDVNLIDLLDTEHRPLANALIPTDQELAAPTWTDEDRSLFQRWSVEYLGRWIPVLRLTVDNSNGTRNLQVFAVEYNVADTLESRGATPPQLDPPRYALDLPFKTGPLRLDLDSQHFGEIGVAPGTAKTLELVLAPTRDAPPLGAWTGKVSVLTNQGTCPVGNLVLMTYNPYHPVGPGEASR